MHNQYEDVELTTGTIVRCRPVPPYALGPVFASLPTPPAPKVNIPSAAGGSETHVALRESPEWDEYQAKMGEYNRLRKRAITDFHLDYGILSWKLPDAKEFTTQPPKGWRIPTIMERYGVDVAAGGSPDQRLQFIKYGLILTDEDADRIDGVIATPRSLSKGDVKAALDPFASSTPTASSL